MHRLKFTCVACGFLALVSSARAQVPPNEVVQQLAMEAARGQVSEVCAVAGQEPSFQEVKILFHGAFNSPNKYWPFLVKTSGTVSCTPLGVEQKWEFTLQLALRIGKDDFGRWSLLAATVERRSMRNRTAADQEEKKLQISNEDRRIESLMLQEIAALRRSAKGVRAAVQEYAIANGQFGVDSRVRSLVPPGVEVTWASGFQIQLSKEVGFTRPFRHEVHCGFLPLDPDDTGLCYADREIILDPAAIRDTITTSKDYEVAGGNLKLLVNERDLSFFEGGRRSELPNEPTSKVLFDSTTVRTIFTDLKLSWNPEPGLTTIHIYCSYRDAKGGAVVEEMSNDVNVDKADGFAEFFVGAASEVHNRYRAGSYTATCQIAPKFVKVGHFIVYSTRRAAANPAIARRLGSDSANGGGVGSGNASGSASAVGATGAVGSGGATTTGAATVGYGIAATLPGRWEMQWGRAKGALVIRSQADSLVGTLELSNGDGSALVEELQFTEFTPDHFRFRSVRYRWTKRPTGLAAILRGNAPDPPWYLASYRGSIDSGRASLTLDRSNTNGEHIIWKATRVP